MFTFLLRNPFLASGRRSKRSPVTFLRLLHHDPISKPLPTSPSSPDSELAVSFFKTSCGLSPSAALASAAKISMKITANAECVLRLLQTYGFTKSSIALIAAKCPALFNSRPEKSIKPKFDLFVAKGFTGNLLVKIFSKHPDLARSSLERKLGPNLNLLMTTLGGNREAVAASIIRSKWILKSDSKKCVLPNIQTLRERGFTCATMTRFFKLCPQILTQNPDRFIKLVASLENMGFDPLKRPFIDGIKAKHGLSQTTWERKLLHYRSLGWSEEETLSAFKRSPMCMLLSEEKAGKVIAFFAENLKWEPSRLALVPYVMYFNFEKRIVPRYAIFKILSTSGLSRINFLTLLLMSETIFLKYLCKYNDAVPELFEAYKVKLVVTEAIPSNHVF